MILLSGSLARKAEDMILRQIGPPRNCMIIDHRSLGALVDRGFSTQDIIRTWNKMMRNTTIEITDHVRIHK